MKLKALANLCRQTGAFCLFDRVGAGGDVTEQWLGNGYAMFPLYGVPYLKEENLITLFDITAKQRENIVFSHDRVSPKLNLSHQDDGEIMLEPEVCTMGYAGRIVRPLFTSGGLAFVNDDLFAPLAGAEVLEIFERKTVTGDIYFAAKLGLMIQGIFMPLNIVDERLVDTMETLARKCRLALDMKKAREALVSEVADEDPRGIPPEECLECRCYACFDPATCSTPTGDCDFCELAELAEAAERV